MIEVVNRQRKVKVPLTGLAEFAEKAVGAIHGSSGKSATIAFVSDSKIKALNAEFRGKHTPTDVLSFPFDESEFGEEGHLGDVVISAETAERQAMENGLTQAGEIRQLILHGLLHLAGYDHETDDGTMDRIEIELRHQLGIDF